MADERDFSWLNRNRPRPGPEPPPVERRLAVFVKDARSIQFFERAHPSGTELRCVLASVDVLWTKAFRPNQRPAFEAELTTAVDALLAAGWTRAES